MERLLIVTLLDYGKYSNNRVHHIAGQFSRHFDSTTVLYKKSYVPGTVSFSTQVKAFFTLSFVELRKGNIRSISVDTLFNKPDGMGLRISGLESPHGKISKAKKILKGILSNLGMFSELFYVPSFLIGYFLKIRGKIDVFIGQDPWTMLTGHMLKKAGLVSVLVYDDYDYAPGHCHTRIRKGLAAWLEKYMIKQADLTVSVGEYLAELRKKSTGKDVFVIPNGVNHPLFRKAQDKQPHPPTLVYMGFVCDWSGVDIALEAVHKLRDKIGQIKFLVIGHTTPGYLNYIESIVERLQLKEHFEYVGNKSYDELPQYLQKADIGLAIFKPIELRKYAFSLKVIEYMAAGLAVVTTRETQSAALVAGHECGEAVAFNSEELSEALYRMLTNREQLKRYVENAIRHSREYDWEDLMNRKLQLIRSYSQKAYPPMKP